MPTAEDRPSLRDVIDVRAQGAGDVFRSRNIDRTALRLYGGQVAGQALLAAGATVSPGAAPHSLHAYFLRAGDPGKPVDFRVIRDRDGRSYSSRRVEATQSGGVILTMTASFASETDTPARDETAHAADCSPESEGFGMSRPFDTGSFSVDVRVQEFPSRAQKLPHRFWARAAGSLEGASALEHAAALAYVSDFSTSLPRRRGNLILGPSLDHSLWFHHTPLWDGWMDVELFPGRARGARGWYSGEIRDGRGRVAAGLAQEMVYRREQAP